MYLDLKNFIQSLSKLRLHENSLKATAIFNFFVLCGENKSNLAFFLNLKCEINFCDNSESHPFCVRSLFIYFINKEEKNISVGGDLRKPA